MRKGRRVLFQRAQSRKPAELARALETTVSSSVVSSCLFFPSLFSRLSYKSTLRYKMQTSIYSNPSRPTFRKKERLGSQKLSK